MIKKKTGLLFTILFLTAGFSFQRIENSRGAVIIIHFHVMVHGESLQLNKKYKNPFGEIFEISRFRFYAGKIAPLYAEEKFGSVASGSHNTSNYQLVDLSDSASQSIELSVPPGSCNGICFELGIDSADQCRGAQSGPLDPVNGMFWTWNSGYQSFKIEGYSPLSRQPAHVMAYHIGGYRSPFSTIWNLKINTIGDEAFELVKEKKIVIEVPIELDYFFNGYTPLHIKEIPSCTTAGALARNISENFIGCFTGIKLISTQ